MKAIGIIRVSSEGQRDRYGPLVQRDDLESKRAELDWELTDVWEFWESATDPDSRPKFISMLNDLVQMGQAGQVQGVLFGHPDRLGRDGAMAFFHYLYMLRQLGKLEVRFSHEDMDPADRHYEDDLFDAAVGAHKDGIRIKRRLRDGRMKRTKEGKFPSNPGALFGYTYNRTTGVREFGEQNYILRALGEKAIAGTQIRPLSRWLRSEYGVRMPPNSIRGLLANPAICGKTVIRWKEANGNVTEIPLPNATPPTFTSDEFEAIQRQLAIHRENSGYNGKQRLHFYPLSGASILSCMACGVIYSGTSKNGRRYYRHQAQEDCPLEWKGDVRAEQLEDKVWKQLWTYFSDPERAVNDLVSQVSSPNMRDTLDLEIRQINEQLEALIVEKERVSLVWSKGRITDDSYEREITRVESEESNLTERRNLKQSQLSSLQFVDRDEILISARRIAGSPRRNRLADPDGELGKEVWSIRRQLLLEVGARVFIKGRDPQVVLGVPVLSQGVVLSGERFS